jgi:hypothetical protein
MSLKTFVSRIFTWWNGQTFGTQVWTALYGEFVGEDVRGNRYYRTKGGKIDPYRRLARLDAPPHGHPADAGNGRAAAVGKAARAEHDRDTVRLSPARIDPCRGPPAGGNGRLPGLAPGPLIRAVHGRKNGAPQAYFVTGPSLESP